VAPKTEERRCPVCGRGILKHLGSEAARPQQPESPIIETYTCGHEVPEDRLETADAERLEVERRSSEETAGRGEGRRPTGVQNP
jgi:hypothetical protein